MPEDKVEDKVEEEGEEEPLSVLYAFTVIMPDGREMIASFEEPDGSAFPMVTLSEAMLDKFKDVAQTIADAVKRPVTLVKFEQRTEVEKITPAKIEKLH
jgi:hypothetical protein